MSSTTDPSRGGLVGAGTSGIKTRSRTNADQAGTKLEAEAETTDSEEQGKRVVDSSNAIRTDATRSSPGVEEEKDDGGSSREEGREGGRRIAAVEAQIQGVQSSVEELKNILLTLTATRSAPLQSVEEEAKTKKKAVRKKVPAVMKRADEEKLPTGQAFLIQGNPEELRVGLSARKWSPPELQPGKRGVSEAATKKAMSPFGKLMGGATSPLAIRLAAQVAALTDEKKRTSEERERQRRREETAARWDPIPLEEDSDDVSSGSESVESATREEMLGKLQFRRPKGGVTPSSGPSAGKGKMEKLSYYPGLLPKKKGGQEMPDGFSEEHRANKSGTAEGVAAALAAKEAEKKRVIAEGMEEAGRDDVTSELKERELPGAWKGPGASDGHFNHPALASANAWGSQFYSVSQAVGSLDMAEGVRRASSKDGLIYVGPGLALAVFRVPSPYGTEDYSGKRVNHKNPSKGYCEGEFNARSEWLVPETAKAMEARFGPVGDFPVSPERLHMYLQAMQDTVGGECWLDPKAGRDSSLTLKPVARRERSSVVSAFRGWVAEKYSTTLTVAIAGRDAQKFVKTREMRLALFVVARFILAFSALSLHKLMEGVEEQWLEYRRGDEEMRGKKQVTIELVDAVRLKGHACPVCGDFGSTERFCSNLRCTKPKEADGSNPPAGAAKAAPARGAKREGPGDYWDKQSEIEALKAPARPRYGSAALGYGLLGST